MPRRRSSATQRPSPRGLTIVGIGASAGGLDAFTQLLSAVPADIGMAIVLVQHMAPNHESALAYLLSPHTPMPVLRATNGVRMLANHVYVIPPDKQMFVIGDRLTLSPRPHDRSRYTPIDTFFTSLSAAAGPRSIAVVLSGTASDGALGIRDIKAAGGITIAQRPESAGHDSMPRAAIATGMVDVILTPAEIGAELARIALHPYVHSAPAPSSHKTIGDGHLRRIFAILQSISGIDFHHYKQPTLRRRLMRRMALNRISDTDKYIELLQSHAGEARALYQDMLIQVTRFFREPESFAALTTAVFPKLLATGDRPWRFWVCGCATGEEAYSLAITTLEFLESRGSDVRAQIFATDVSDTAIEHARAGYYPESIAADLGQERLRRYFKKTDGRYRINRQVREMCIFARQDLTKDPPFSRLDVIMCRNVLIYMDVDLQRKLLGMFHYALNPDGFLVLGRAETVGTEGSLFALTHKKHRIHQRKGGGARLPAAPFLLADVPLPPAHTHPQGAPSADKNLDAEASRVILDRYAPSGVIVTDALQIVQFRGQTGDYLEPAPGEASLNLLKMAREGLLFALRTAVQTAHKTNQPVRREAVQMRRAGRTVPVDIEVVPLQSGGKPHFLVTFEQDRRPDGAAKRDRTSKGRGKDTSEKISSRAAVQALQRELDDSRSYLQSIIQELEAANEELQSANEEILSSNEELQSTNEELDTAKEELQSTNEELITVNDELTVRNDEVTRVNSDLVNLLGSIHIAIVIVNGDLHIRRFTPMAEKVFNLIPSDIDRSIRQINTELELPELAQLIMECIDTVTLIEREVKDRQGHWYSLRIRPYKALDKKIDGAVLALFDIDALKRSEQRAQLAHGLAATAIAAMPQPAALLEHDLRVRVANPALAALVGARPADLRGRRLAESGGETWRLDDWLTASRLPGTPLPKTMIAADGNRPELEATGDVVQDPDDPSGVLIILRVSSP